MSYFGGFEDAVKGLREEDFGKVTFSNSCMLDQEFLIAD